MSFDLLLMAHHALKKVSQSLSSRAMSFDGTEKFLVSAMVRLNPFRAGRCLSTRMKLEELGITKESQSLSSRAMSFD